MDLVHGYEWPPILEGMAATQGTRAMLVGTVLSMAVADFVPRTVPLVVGTADIRTEAARGRRAGVHLSCRSQRPPTGPAPTPRPSRRPSPGGRGSGRLWSSPRPAQDVKLEGILTAVLWGR